MATLLAIDGGRVAVVSTYYKTSELLGAGRYAEVYRALDTNSQTDVALKLYRGFDTAAHDMAESEASLLRKLAALNSPYFPALRRSTKQRVRNQNHPLLVLELGSYAAEDGSKRVISLKDTIPAVGSDLPLPEVGGDFWCVNSLVRWMLHMVQAVKQLHSLGLIHRDIKPANILVRKGPGQSEPVPFVLDFNSASNVSETDSGRGTPLYLPPEVKIRKRLAPSPEDDLWAVAMVAREMLFGQGSSPDGQQSQFAAIKGHVPEALVACLSRALSVNPEARFRTADELISAIESCLPPDRSVGLTLTNDEVSRARAQMHRVRLTIIEAFAPPGQIVVPKEVDDNVTQIFGWLSQADSQALNLFEELMKLGPAAIPACLQQGYRLRKKAEVYDDVVVALGELSKLALGLARRSIDAFALSSNGGVRELCWRVCERLEYFPEALLTSLSSDDGLLLPDERLGLAGLCIRFSGGSTAVEALIRYMCREYVVDRSRYRELRDAVARHMGDVKCEKTAQLIWEACRSQVWSDLPDFRSLPEATKPEVEGGLIELFADAFAATPDAGLKQLKKARSQWVPEQTRPPMFRRFSVKSGRQDPAVRAWLLDECNRSPHDNMLRKVVDALSERKEGRHDNPQALLQQYFKHEDPQSYGELRFLKGGTVFEALEAQISKGSTHQELALVLKLLRGFQTRNRWHVVDVLLRHWPAFSGEDYKLAAEILAAFPKMLTEGQRAEAVAILNTDLEGKHHEAARKALEILLK